MESSSSDASNMQDKRFQEIQDKLRSFHYCQPFSVDSVGLVEKLLDDVVQSIENFEMLASR